MDVFTREKGIYAFGPFRLDPVRRALWRDGERMKIGARLFDTLLYLVENHDRLVERDELQQAVWQGRVVEEGNLGQAISALRKTLQGDGIPENFIVTVAGRGYRFGAPVEFLPAPPSALPTDLPGAPDPAGLPPPRHRPRPARRAFPPAYGQSWPCWSPPAPPSSGTCSRRPRRPSTPRPTPSPSSPSPTSAATPTRTISPTASPRN